MIGKIYLVFFVIVCPLKQALGAADFDVEQVLDLPEVEKHDIGQMMSSIGNHEENPHDVNRMLNDHRSSSCIACRLLSVDSTLPARHSSNSYYSSSSSSNANHGEIYTHELPLRTSSSRVESTNKQKFVNGQQVYDLQHETEYKDGRLIKNDKRERLPSDFGVGGIAEEDSTYLHTHLNNRVNQAQSIHGAHSSLHEFEKQSSRSHNLNQNDFESEVERMKGRLNAYGSHQVAPYGSSHKSEYESESKFVNGKQVYHRKEERKYEDGRLVHDVKEEKGPEDFGVSNHLSRIEETPISHSRPMISQSATENQYSTFSSQRQQQRISKPSLVSSNEMSRTNVQFTPNSNVYLPYQPQYTADNSYRGVSSSVSRDSKQNVISSSHSGMDKDITHYPVSYNSHKITDGTYDNGQFSQHQGKIKQASSSSYYDFRSDIRRPSVRFTTMGIDNKIAPHNQYLSSSSSPTKHSSSYSVKKESYNKTAISNRPLSSGGYQTAQDHLRKYSSISPSSTYKNSNTFETSRTANHSSKYTNRPAYDQWPGYPTGHDSTIKSSSQNYDGWQSKQEEGRNYAYDSRTKNYYHSNSAFDNIKTSGLPVSRIETTTILDYVNGRLSGETLFNKFYDFNDILLHENQTHRSRDQMSVDGINVLNMDLSETKLARHGLSAGTSQKHSQRIEIHRIVRYKNGIQTYELNHERLFQDGNLIDEKRYEQDGQGNNHENVMKQSVHHAPRLRNNDEHHHQHLVSLKPTQFTRKHEINQEEKYENGQKVYDLYHSKEYKDGKLINENKTELGPSDLGVHTSGYQDYMKVIQDRGGYHSPQQALFRQESVANNELRTTCLTCSQGHHSFERRHGSRTNLNLDSSSLATKPRLHNENSYYDRDSSDGDLSEQYKTSHLVGRKEHRSGLVNEKLSQNYNYKQSSSHVNRSAFTTGTKESYASWNSPVIKRTWTIREAVVECGKKPCQNKGSCKARNSGPICVCPFGIKGNNCQEIYCPVRYCQNGGKCSIQNNRHVCDCPPGYSGLRCGTETQRIRIGVTG